ncbi:MAG: ribonuclease III [Ruminococcaceae bacterium]|nr:ribonuclease III [Oscillospiraceae bacterium]
MSIENPDNITPLILAYVGDSALEVLVRQKLAMEGITKPGEINKLALNYVTAKNQCAACDRIMEHLTEKESDIYRRGKNAKSHSNPRNVSVYEYRKATGLEAVFGYNYLLGNHERNKELFAIAYE